MKKFKRLGIILGSIVVLAIVYVFVHNLYVKNRFSPFFEKMEDGEASMIYDGRFQCGVSKPKKITSWRGNLFATKIRNVKAKDEVYCDLIIWVEAPSGYTIWVQICDLSGNVKDEIWMNNKMELTKEDEEQQKLLEQYRDVIYEACEAADEVFDVFDLPSKS